MDVSNFKRNLSNILQLEIFQQKTQDCSQWQYPVESTTPSATVAYFQKNITYKEFFEKHLSVNVPCIFANWITSNWRSRKVWTKTVDGLLLPDYSDLMKKCQSSKVPVADCKNREFNSQSKRDWSLKDYLNYLVEDSKQEHSGTDSSFYLKDWHFFREFPEYQAYHVPSFFMSDWLFELWQQQLPPFQDDFRFVYIGPSQSWTPFHADVYRSFSWSANICGKKKWFLIPAGQEEALKDENGHLPYDITKCEMLDKVDAIEVIQNAGEIIFIPSGWYHQVHNLEETISINHNWINGCNIYRVWRFLQEELRDVRKEISDCHEMMSDDEWEDQCQLIMKVNSGMNFWEFFTMLKNISILRLRCIVPDPPVEGVHFGLDRMIEHCRDTIVRLIAAIEDDVTSGNLQVLLDLCCVIPVLLEMRGYYESKKLRSCSRECTDILRKILNCLHIWC